MKYILPLFALSLWLVGCSKPSSDANIRRDVVGTWIENSTGYTNTFVYAADGSFRVTTRKPSDTHSDAGTWQISGGFMLDRYTNASSHQVDITVKYSIIHLDSHQIVREHEGHTFTLNRHDA